MSASSSPSSCSPSDDSAAGLRLVIACGGTGGHVHPALAVGREARRRGADVVFAVAGQHRGEHLRLARSDGFRAVGIAAPRLPATPRAAAGFMVNFPKGVIEASRVLRGEGGGVVLGMGSFASAPVCVAAALRRSPLFLHEGNAILGRANRLLSRQARCLAISLPLAEEQAPRCPTAVTGFPVRESMIAASRFSVDDAWYREWNLEVGRPTLLVFGGSQGAQAINRAMLEAVPVLASTGYRAQILHFTGRENNDRCEQVYRQAGWPYRVVRSEALMERAYLLADIVICRAGAATIAELGLFAKPAILVPLSSAADDHQTANARNVEQQAAGVVLAQARLTTERLAGLLSDWFENRPAWRQRGDRMRAFAHPHAARDIVEMILDRTQPGAGQGAGKQNVKVGGQ